MAAAALLVEFTTDDPSDTSPSWVDVTDRVRSFQTNRGRDSEMSVVEAGTASVTLSNRAREFSPANDESLRPMNRWRISAVLDSGTEEIFLGYAESYDQMWPAHGFDAVTVVSLVDEFKVLALDRLPTTDPPRDSYQEVALFDGAQGYWPLLYPNTGAAVVGEALRYQQGTVGGGATIANTQGAIVGQTDGGYIYTSHDDYWSTNELFGGQSGDAGGLAEFTIEGWIAIDGVPAATELLFSGPNGIPSHTYTWKLSLNTAKQLVLQAKNTSGTVHTATSTTVLTEASVGPSTLWYHVVGTITGGNLRLYVNGVPEGATSWTGTFEFIDNANTFAIGDRGNDIGANVRAFDEVAFYRVGLTVDRVLAHYTAGRERGFPRDQDPGDRVDAVLDAIDSTATRNVQTGTRAMTGTYMTGQPPLDEIRQAERAENVDAVFFIAKDGAVTFLADGHRTSSPYDTVQATFSDDGDHLPYQDIDVDYSESFLFNEWNVTRTGGTTSTASDPTSITRYFKRSQALNDIEILSSTDQDEIAAALLAKYKEPMTRVTALELRATETVAEAVLPLDIGARVRVIRTPTGVILLYPAVDLYPATDLYPAAGRIDQTSFIQRITVDGVPGQPWRLRLGISPI